MFQQHQLLLVFLKLLEVAIGNRNAFIDLYFLISFSNSFFFLLFAAQLKLLAMVNILKSLSFVFK